MTLRWTGLVGLGVAILLMAGALSAGRSDVAVPENEPRYRECVSYSLKREEGGGEASARPGLSKAQLWCACLWRGAPAEFSGPLAVLARSPEGGSLRQTCHAQANWGG